MRNRGTLGTTALIVLALVSASSINADSFEELVSVGSAGRVHQAGGVFLPVFDEAGDRHGKQVFLLQGGFPAELDAEPVAEVWILADGSWKGIETDAPAMAGHNLVRAADGRAYAIGGVGTNDWFRPTHRISAFRIVLRDGDLGVEHQEISVPGPTPDASAGAAAISVGDGRSILYVGGSDFFGGGLGDLHSKEVWEYQIVDNRWQRLTDMPEGRSGHSVVKYRDDVLVFGGDSSGGLRNDVLRYDVLADTWNWVNTNGYRPDPREDHRAVVAGSSMLVFGGIERPFFDETMDDIWELDLTDLTWTEKTYLPTGLANMAVDVIPSRLGIFGRIQVLIYGGLIDAWSFPFDLSDSTAVYTFDEVFAFRGVSPPAHTR